MLDFAGSHAVASSTGRRVLLGAFESTVAVLDLEPWAVSAPFETTFDFGGRRLALSDELDVVVAAAYGAPGLACYCAKTGREQWRRKDLKKVQHVTLSRDGRTAFCGRTGAPLAVVDLASGQPTSTVRGAEALLESQFDPWKFVAAGRPYLLHDDGQHKVGVERTTFALLDACFAPGSLVLSESCGPVRCLEATTGREIWRSVPQPGRHVLRLGFESAERTVLGVEWAFAKGGAKRLRRWSVDDGSALGASLVFQSVDSCFALDGAVLVLSDGRVVRVTADGPSPRTPRAAPLGAFG
jgi:hypothetical protein